MFSALRSESCFGFQEQLRDFPDISRIPFSSADIHGLPLWNSWGGGGKATVSEVITLHHYAQIVTYNDIMPGRTFYISDLICPYSSKICESTKRTLPYFWQAKTCLLPMQTNIQQQHFYPAPLISKTGAVLGWQMYICYWVRLETNFANVCVTLQNRQDKL